MWFFTNTRSVQPPDKFTFGCVFGNDWQDFSCASGRIEIEKFSKTLRWESQVGRAYTSGGVSYQFMDGALQVNETGIYHVYSRVELVFRVCSPASFFLHSVFVRRDGRLSPLTLMEAHRAGFCPQQSARSWTTDSYLASALQLQTHDRVYVNVSHPTFLSHAHYANFFGLYKIWSDRQTQRMMKCFCRNRPERFFGLHFTQMIFQLF